MKQHQGINANDSHKTFEGSHSCNINIDKNGKVYIIGVGTGDYKLITLKAVECIEKADIIVYDRLINKKILKLRKDSAELIYVGKKANMHIVPQEQINRILVKYALEGKIVARVKGGDPFVFGRGGEEAYYLSNHNISFEIIPGITSAIAVPAYAGIPVTHRDYSSSFHVITGHEKSDKYTNCLDYKILAKLNDTLIFLMGVNNAKNISENLILHGKAPSTPVAIIENGTTTSQRVVKGTLDTISDIIIDNNIKSPTIIIVGKVVELQSNLNWFSKKPLYGKRIIVTRPTKQAVSLINKIEDFGGEIIEIPTIEIVELEDYTIVDNELMNLKYYDWIVFTSINGVKTFFKRLRANNIDIRKLGNIKISAIGDTTEKELNKLGLNVDFVPKEFTTNALLEGLLNNIKKEEKVLLPRGNMANPNIVEGLAKNNIECSGITVYKTLESNLERKDVVNELDYYVDFITFTSPSTVRSFIKLLGKDNMTQILNINTVCIGPVTADAAREEGFMNVFSSDVYTEEGLIEKILELSEV